MKIKEIAKYLNIPEIVAIGFARAGFFGFGSKSGHFNSKAIDACKNYGLQWDTKLKKRSLPRGLEPVVKGWENPPLHTLSEYAVSIEKDTALYKDSYWVANFFFIPNDFYFSNPDTLCRYRST